MDDSSSQGHVISFAGVLFKAFERPGEYHSDSGDMGLEFGGD
jgi:hypothetical protein